MKDQQKPNERLFLKHDERRKVNDILRSLIIGVDNCDTITLQQYEAILTLGGKLPLRPADKGTSVAIAKSLEHMGALRDLASQGRRTAKRLWGSISNTELMLRIVEPERQGG